MAIVTSSCIVELISIVVCTMKFFFIVDILKTFQSTASLLLLSASFCYVNQVKTETWIELCSLPFTDTKKKMKTEYVNLLEI